MKTSSLFFWVLSLFMYFFSQNALAQNTQIKENTPPISLQADLLKYDQNNDLLMASGQVEIEQDGQILLADEVTYSKTRDIATAKGNVTIVGVNGETYFADEAKLSDGLKSGFAKNISTIMSDGSRFVARSGQRIDGHQIIVTDGVYSACRLCEENPTKPPIWQMRAGRIIHDSQNQNIYYHNARMEIFGVPVIYTPYFSHPEPSVERRSGFVKPSFSFDSKLGAAARNYYYFDIAPDKDATVELSVTSKQNSVLGGEWRQRFEHGELFFEGSINRSTIRGGSDDDTILKERDWRGHIFSTGRYDMNDQWRAGFNINRTIDDFYLKDFDYSSDDILKNDLYLERFSGRNYTNANLTYFQDLRPNITEEQPKLTPLIEHKAFGNPNELFGGRWAMNSQFLNLIRDGDQSMSRLSLHPSWERQDYTKHGLKISSEAILRNDNYWIRDLAPGQTGSGDDDQLQSRFLPSAHFKSSYPLIKPIQSSRLLIEPITSLTLSPNQSIDDDIPNEDSRDIQLDISNLFENNRFSGNDRIETGSHAAYGLKTGVYTGTGNSAFLTLGQSYRFTDDNSFPNGSGLENDKSDYVGQIELTMDDTYFLDYRFQFDEDSLKGRRHEMQAAVIKDDYTLRGAYLFAQAVAGTGITDRQQFQIEGEKQINPTWAVFGSTLNDLSGDAGLLKASAGVEYKNDCFRLSVKGERDLTDRSSGGAEDRILFSVGLRNLGGYNRERLKHDELFSGFEY